MRLMMLSPAVLLLVCLSFSGCSPLTDQVKTLAESVSVTRDPVTQARAKIESALHDNQPLRAQAELLKALQLGVEESSLHDLFVAVESRLLKDARAAEETQSFGRAGELYRMAMDVYPKTANVAALLATSRDELKAKLDMCADELMKRGLMFYRKGNLLAAVQAWKKITLFMPDHSPSVVAIETAEQQIANLEKLSPAQDN